TLGALMTATVLLVACQPSRGGGGGASQKQAPPPHVEPGYNPNNQPAVNELGTPGPVLEGGRVGREAEGPNRGAQGNPPPEGYRGSGSRYNPPPTPILEKQKIGASPSPAAPARSR
ncbi:MAG TPA: hypothetical protein V6D05_02540, partial [Stenomitos sp.]